MAKASCYSLLISLTFSSFGNYHTQMNFWFVCFFVSLHKQHLFSEGHTGTSSESGRVLVSLPPVHSKYCWYFRQCISYSHLTNFDLFRAKIQRVNILTKRLTEKCNVRFYLLILHVLCICVSIIQTQTISRQTLMLYQIRFCVLM